MPGPLPRIAHAVHAAPLQPLRVALRDAQHAARPALLARRHLGECQLPGGAGAPARAPLWRWLGARHAGPRTGRPARQCVEATAGSALRGCAASGPPPQPGPRRMAGAPSHSSPSAAHPPGCRRCATMRLRRARTGTAPPSCTPSCAATWWATLCGSTRPRGTCGSSTTMSQVEVYHGAHSTQGLGCGCAWLATLRHPLNSGTLGRHHARPAAWPSQRSPGSGLLPINSCRPGQGQPPLHRLDGAGCPACSRPMSSACSLTSAEQEGTLGTRAVIGHAVDKPFVDCRCIFVALQNARLTEL